MKIINKSLIAQSLFCLSLFLLFGCSQTGQKTGLQVSSNGVSRALVKNLAVEAACLLSKQGKKLTVTQRANEMLKIMRRNGLDPSNKAEMDKVKIAIEEFKADESFKNEAAKEFIVKCMNT
jgi:hypothetical protein